MNHDDKIYEAAKRHCWSRDKISDVYEGGFYNGAKFRDTEIKALLEIVKAYKSALSLCKEQRDDAIWNRFKLKPQYEKVFFANELAEIMDKELEAIAATDEKLKELGVEI